MRECLSEEAWVHAGRSRGIGATNPPSSAMNSRRCSGRDVRFIARPADLSWLNPTPHAIAVYASQPLPLLDHLVGPDEQTGRYCQPKSLCSFEVDD